MVNEDLVHAVEEKVRENRRFTIMSLSLHFHRFHGQCFTKLSDKVMFQKLCANWVPKLLMEEHELKQQVSMLDFLTRYGGRQKLVELCSHRG